MALINGHANAPDSPEYFQYTIQPLIEGNYIWKGRPPEIGHYQVFCAILYVLRTGSALAQLADKWHSIYMRFKRGSEHRLLWWHILMTLQQRWQMKLNIVLVDSAATAADKKGAVVSGQKPGGRHYQAAFSDYAEKSCGCKVF